VARGAPEEIKNISELPNYYLTDVFSSTRSLLSLPSVTFSLKEFGQWFHSPIWL
jgi:hypothetical protein